jgi:hypothetical protein
VALAHGRRASPSGERRKPPGSLIVTSAADANSQGRAWIGPPALRDNNEVFKDALHRHELAHLDEFAENRSRQIPRSQGGEGSCDYG